MSEKMTLINLPGLPSGEGYMDWGVCSPESVIATMRARAVAARKFADAIDAAADEDFKIDVVRGSIVQHHIRNIQPGRKP